MVIFSTAFIMVVLAEMGDKTQLLAMAFAAKYPWKKVMLGVLFATLLNHFVAIAAGIYLNTLVPQHIVEIVASVAFIIFGLWILKDDELGDEAEKSRFSIFWTVAIAFFLSEMGDKTQLATVALSAQIGTDLLIILIGTTVGMLVADGIGIALGAALHKYVPDRVIKKIASGIFILFGVLGILNSIGILSLY
ncbi:MAG TPA: TMEM165/GDT1 family protein [Candidatus Megamonas gallistercoris]|nr:TMEM165/GDT1 family protein [Candidatus Megamonas gallistercoris]